MGMFSGIIRRSNSNQVKKQDSIEVKLANFLSRYERNAEDYYIEDGKVNCKKSVTIYNDDLIDNNLPFKFSRVDGDFDCSCCDSLTSLVGAPGTVDGDFLCCFCYSLTSLVGAPNSVGDDFNCSGCPSLTSLVGAPNYVGGDFLCGGCDSLISL